MFSPFFDFAKIFAEKGEFGEKTRDSNRFVWAFRVSVLRRFPKKIFTIWSWLVGKYRQLTPKTKICSFSLLQNAKRRAIIPTQLNKNSIRASGGNLNRLDYQAPCESKWLWDNYIILYSNERCTVNGWTTERRASQNDTGLLYHFGSTAFFIARIARTTKEVFSSWSGKDFFFCPKIFGTLEQFRFLALFLIRRERKIKVLLFRGFKNEGVFLYMVKDIRSCRKNWILFSTHGCIFPPLCPKKMRGFFKKFSDQG